MVPTFTANSRTAFQACSFKPSSAPNQAESLIAVYTSFADTTCSPSNIAVHGEVRGDYGAFIQYNLGTLLAGQSVSTKIQHQRN